MFSLLKQKPLNHHHYADRHLNEEQEKRVSEREKKLQVEQNGNEEKRARKAESIQSLT